MLIQGKFYVTQTTPLKFYHANNYKSEFTISYGDSKYSDTCYNDPYKIRAIITKQDIETGKKVNNATFGIYEYDNSSIGYIRICDFNKARQSYNYITEWVYY